MKKKYESVAEFIRQCGAPWRGDAKMYRVTPPLNGYRYVIVSGIFDPITDIPETYIFGCLRSGRVEVFEELNGSFRGEVNHTKALRKAGYRIKWSVE